MNLLSSTDSSSFPKKYSGLLHVTAGSLLKGFSNVDDTHRQYATTHNFLFRLSNLSISNQLLENKSSLGNFQNYLFCRKNFYYLQENDPTRKHKRLTEVSKICTMQLYIFIDTFKILLKCIYFTEKKQKKDFQMACVTVPTDVTSQFPRAVFVPSLVPMASTRLQLYFT